MKPSLKKTKRSLSPYNSNPMNLMPKPLSLTMNLINPAINPSSTSATTMILSSQRRWKMHTYHHHQLTIIKTPYVDSTYNTYANSTSNAQQTSRKISRIRPINLATDCYSVMRSQKIYSETCTIKQRKRDSLTFIQRKSYPYTMEPLWPDGGSKIPRCISGTFHRYPSQIEILRRTPSETDLRRRNGTTLSPMSR